MEELQSYFEEKFHLIKQSRELVNGDQEETQVLQTLLSRFPLMIFFQAILLELNTFCLSMKAQLTQHKKEVLDWKQQIDSAKR